MKNESNEPTVKASRDLLKEKFRLIKNDNQTEPRKKPRPRVKIVIDELPPAA